MVKFKSFYSTDMDAIERQLNVYIKENNISKQQIQHFEVSHTPDLTKHCVTMMYNTEQTPQHPTWEFSDTIPRMCMENTWYREMLKGLQEKKQ